MITCELCGERFSDTRQLAKHRGDVHASVYCHVCEQCTDIRYREKAKLTQHLRRIHKIPVHQCQGCDHEVGHDLYDLFIWILTLYDILPLSL